IDDDWGAFGYSTLVKLLPGTSHEEFGTKVTKGIDKYYEDKDEKDLENKEFYFSPFAGYHLAEYGSGNGMTEQSDPVYSYILSGIALLILLIACFNFMNLSLGRSSTRFKEIGLRKVVGAKRHQLIRQFLFESIALGILALIAGIILAEIFNPTFNSLSEEQISLDYFQDPFSLIFIASVIIISSIITGSYPAFLLSGLKTTNILKGSQRIGGKNLLTRSLVVFQFALSVLLIVGTFIMNDQQVFIIDKDLGFDKEDVMVIPTFADITDPKSGDRMLQYYKEKTAAVNSVIDVSGCLNSLGKGTNMRMVEKAGGEDELVVENRVDYNYLDFMKIELSEGRFFDNNKPADITGTIVVNETFVKTFEIENPVNYSFSGYEKEKDVTIIGVIKDHHVNHLKSKIPPLALNVSPDRQVKYILLKFKPGSVSEVLKTAENIWKEIKPFQPFEFSFMDDDVLSKYDNDRRWSRIITFASVFAVFIACLGLFGLTNISISRRFKEIGIRKVLGAKIHQIIELMNREFIIMILTGNVIAWPAAYYIMNKWLESFQYRVDMQISSFILAALLVLAVALITICVQVIRAAIANPVDSLRYE
ncbi:MAG: FtsX-like permease family protein, partial [bacterium]|nr:FtsX-like permease family protein [bacterium]